MPKYIPTEAELNDIRKFRENRARKDGLSKLKTHAVLMRIPLGVWREYQRLWGKDWTNKDKYQIEFLRKNPQYKVADPSMLRFKEEVTE